MKAIALIGSRNPDGQTAQAVNAFLQGLEFANMGYESIFLPPLQIERCRQCDETGWGLCKKEGRCKVQDDFARLVEKIRTADAAVFATPVYFSDLSESLKAFLDRLRRITRHDEGKTGLAGKPAVGICVAGGGGGGSALCAFGLEKTLATCGFSVVDMVPVRRQNLDRKIALLRVAGEQFGANPATG